MGLDVYLYKLRDCIDTFDEFKKIDKALEQMTSDAWDEAYRQVFKTDEVDWSKVHIDPSQWNEMRPIRDAVYKSLVESSEYAHIVNADEEFTKIHVDLPSTIHPDHIFNIGYYRSSYNSGGINSVMRRIGAPDLYNIFFGLDDDADSYYVQPDWEASLDRVNAALSYLETHRSNKDLIWYIEAYEVVKESIEYVLSQPDPHRYLFGWSS